MADIQIGADQNPDIPIEIEVNLDPQNMCDIELVESCPTSEEKRPLNANWGILSNITSDELILIKFKLLQVTSHNKSINIHLIVLKF